MVLDFTYEMYDRLVESGVANGYEFVTMKQYFDSEELPERFIVMRHDVDRKPGNALDFARIEADHGVSSTYYFRTIEKTFDEMLLRRIEALGHEIGYHYEDMDRTKGIVDAARDSFANQLKRLRKHATVETICMHGNPLTRYDNRDMWTDREYTQYGIVGEAYLDMDFTDVMYFSDTGRTWKDGPLKVKDHTIGDDAKRTQVRTTMELMELFGSGEIDRFCVLTHPNRWSGDIVELAAETTKDVVANVGKIGLRMARSG